MKKYIVLLLFFVCTINLFSQIRSFNEVFPELPDDVKTAAFSESGFYKSGYNSKGFSFIGIDNNTKIDPAITGNITNKKLGFLVESILVVPVAEKEITLLSIYNGLSKIQNLNNVQYSMDKKERVPLFRDASRIIGEKDTKSIDDPPFADYIPSKEVIYLKVRDANFGNTYFKNDILLITYGLHYTLTNFRHITFLFIPVVKEKNFIAQLYIEPLLEGVLLYIIGGADLSDFLLTRINIDSAITKRINVFKEWAIDGITNENRH